MRAVNPKPNQFEQSSRRSELFARLMWGALAVAGLNVIALVACRVVGSFLYSELIVVLSQHAPAFLGVPFVMLAAIVLIESVRAIDGRLELDFFGLKFEGASTSVFLLICAVQQ